MRRERATCVMALSFRRDKNGKWRKMMPRLLATLALARSLSFMRLVYDDDNIFARKWPPSFLPPLPLQSGWLPRSFPLFIHVRGAPIMWPRGGREFVSPEQCNCAMCMIHRASRNRTGGTKKPPLHADLAPSASQPCSKEDGREDRGRRKLNR